MFEYKDYVYEVYKERSFSKAAANLYISQPSLSARIIKIEEKLGMPIFDRSTSPLRLTDFGRMYIKSVEDVYEIEKRVEDYAREANALLSGELSIGASNVFAAYTLPPIIAEFKKKYPSVNIRLTEGNTEMLESLLSTNRVDTVIDNNRYDMGLYERTPIYEERILLAVPKIFDVCLKMRDFELSDEDIRSRSYRCAEHPSVPLAAFSDIPFIMLTPSNDTRIRADKMCREVGFRPKIVLEVHQQATAYMIATTSVGATLVSETVVEKMPSQKTLSYFKIDSPAALRTVYFYFKKHKQKSRATEEFIKQLSGI